MITQKIITSYFYDVITHNKKCLKNKKFLQSACVTTPLITVLLTIKKKQTTFEGNTIKLYISGEKLVRFEKCSYAKIRV